MWVLVKDYSRVFTVECSSFVGQLNISFVILAKHFPSRISPSFPGKQKFIIVPGLRHDLLEIWNTNHFFYYGSCACCSKRKRVAPSSHIYTSDVVFFFARQTWFYLDPVDGRCHLLCRPELHCTWSPCWTGECCTERGKSISDKEKLLLSGFSIKYRWKIPVEYIQFVSLNKLKW